MGYMIVKEDRIIIKPHKGTRGVGCVVYSSSVLFF